VNPLLLHMLLPGLREDHTGRRISGVHWSEPILEIDFASPGRCSLVVILSDPGPFCFPWGLDSFSQPGSLRVFEEIIGSTLEEISIPGHDRTLTLSGAGDNGNWTLSLLLFGSSGCALLHRGQQMVRSVGGNPDRFQEITAQPGNRLSVVNIRRETIENQLDSDGQLSGRIPGLDTRLVDCFSSSSGQCDIAGLLEFRDRMLTGEEPFYLYQPPRLGRAFPLPVTPAGLDTAASILGPFTSAGAACRELGLTLIESAHDKILEKQLKPLRKRLNARQTLRQRLQQELNSAADHVRLRRETETLAAYQTRIKPGAGSVELPDPYDPDSTLIIELDPASSIPEQIRKRFKRATKLERSGDKIKRRLVQIDSELSHLEEILARFDTIGKFKEAQDFLNTALKNLKLSRTPAALEKSKDSVKTYRQFDVHPAWFVMVGRSNRENDEITFKVAGPEDLWFHAQNVPGSHVILKSRGGKETNPPRQVLALTAGIAAFYSKSRHASLVPVIFTRRKYVRKPRKAPPGQVICEREKTIFAEPALPPSTHPIDDE
jgi:predicted ribosome quality control (RQC) complex YloA/Tae2 family protein